MHGFKQKVSTVQSTGLMSNACNDVKANLDACQEITDFLSKMRLQRSCAILRPAIRSDLPRRPPPRVEIEPEIVRLPRVQKGQPLLSPIEMPKGGVRKRRKVKKFVGFNHKATMLLAHQRAKEEGKEVKCSKKEKKKLNRKKIYYATRALNKNALSMDLWDLEVNETFNDKIEISRKISANTLRFPARDMTTVRLSDYDKDLSPYYIAPKYK